MRKYKGFILRADSCVCPIEVSDGYDGYRTTGYETKFYCEIMNPDTLKTHSVSGGIKEAEEWIDAAETIDDESALLDVAYLRAKVEEAGKALKDAEMDLRIAKQKLYKAESNPIVHMKREYRRLTGGK